jgi:CBS-domain-containing membrane protein
LQVDVNSKTKQRVSFAPLFKPCGEFTKLGKSEHSTSVGSISNESSVGDAIHRLSDTHFHRLFIVDQARKPTGVVSLIDIISFITEKAH